MDKSRLQYLLQRYSDNTATPAELRELSGYIGQSPDDELFAEAMQDMPKQEALHGVDLEPYEQLAGKALLFNRSTNRIPKWVWAAACLPLLLLGGFYYLHKQPQAPPLVKTVVQPPPQIPPGKNGAILTLEDGRTVLLDSLGNGKIASQHGADVVIDKGSLTYANANNDNRELVYNTLSTPRGRQFHIQLSDGSAVWLNAASSIRYPIVFSGAQRVVEITGEAYFEIAKNAAQPFIVKTERDAQIEVLGTGFNVNAYANEAVAKTTLIEGKVRVAAGGSQPVVLRPGEQVSLLPSSQLSQPLAVETEKVVAWKNGVFDFTDESLQDVMKQLERWYDIDVVYEKNIPIIRFYGKMTKNISLNDLLIILEKSKVHFQIEGRTLIVKP